MHIDLNRLIKSLVKYSLQKYVGIQTCNSLFITKSADNYKDKVFRYGKCLHATINNEVQCITCIPIKPKNIIQIKCDLYFCDEYHEYNITDEELDDGPNALWIHLFFIPINEDVQHMV